MPRRNRILAGLLALLPPLVGAAPPEKAAKPAAESKAVDLHVTPKAAPSPALRYRLLPLESERTPGDAAPIYIRLGVGLGGAAAELEKADNETADWLEKPLDQFPVAEARKRVNQWSLKLEQLDFGARRRTCDWNYTLPEQREHAVEILLPDAQEIRRWARLLALRARVEVAEHRYEDAARSVETGMSLGRHTARGAFVISALVGAAIAHVMLERLEELVAQPDAPNLYWSLTALPRPLVDLRGPIETEYKMGEWIVPELAESDRPRTDAEWSSLLARLHARLVAVGNLVEPNRGGGGPLGAVAKFFDLAVFKARLLPEAAAYARDRIVRGAPISDDEAIVRYVAARYREFRDEAYSPTYLPYPEAIPFYDAADRRIEATRLGPLRPLMATLEGMRNAHRAAALLDRRVAALRVVEALRLHARRQRQHAPRVVGSVDDRADPPRPRHRRPLRVPPRRRGRRPPLPERGGPARRFEAGVPGHAPALTATPRGRPGLPSRSAPRIVPGFL